LAHVFAVPVALVRLIFVVLTFFHLLGVLLYLGFWVVIPRRPGDDSPLERVLQELLALASRLGGRQPPPGPPPPVDPNAR
jgi:hypothetical protein